MRCRGSISHSGTFSENPKTADLLGGAPREKLPAYASLLKYGDTDVVVRTSEQALERGYGELKVHETGQSEIAAAAQVLRQHNGGSLMVDVNAPWTLTEALSAVAPMGELGLKWIEEPLWPLEDFEAARQVSAAGVPVAIGENVLTPTDFARLIDSRAVDYIQPSVAKIGGISIMRDIIVAANAANMQVAPHSAYFGAGLIATVHLGAALSRAPVVERLFCDLTESPFGDWYEPVAGHLAVPQGPGLGIDPDPAILDKLTVA
jgi:D-galactarolactone cycloisomerase